MTPRRLVLTFLLLLLAGAGVTALRATTKTVADCPPGFQTRQERIDEELRMERAGLAEAKGTTEVTRLIAAGPECGSRKRPEPQGELLAVQREGAKRFGADPAALRPGARSAAAGDRASIEAAGRSLPGSGGTWAPAGSGPLIADDQRFTEVNGLGLAELAGRPSDVVHDPATDRVFAAIGEGGVWQSDDRGGSWRSIGDTLPTQAVGGIAFTPADGGTLIVTTGDNVFGGGGTFAGMGAFRSTDGGASWQKATGVPDGVISFKVTVDPTNPGVVYAGTGAGLFRSTDAGRSFTNVALPTGDCAGKPAQGACYLANMVTDVVVQGADNDVTPDDRRPGTVLAAVGWRAGAKQNPGGFADSPANGLYTSASGEPGSFERLDPAGFAPQDRIGRVELGNAIGDRQNRAYVYAIVQDAEKFRGGVSSIDAPEEETGPLPGGTELEGLYVSDDFGRSWTQMASAEELANDPSTGSALFGTGTAIQFQPGIQAWYNLFIRPDPTRQSADGVPTRLAFGLEEVWANRDESDPLDGKERFRVVGPYFSGDTCLFLSLGAPSCPTTAGDPQESNLTTHPDQQTAIWLPEQDGGVTLLVGHDGGFNRQRLGATTNQTLNPDRWGRGAVRGFETLLPYDAQVAKDGTIYAGLQDNGEMKIEPDGRRFMTFGGDGTISAVDPDNSDVAYEATPLNAIRATVDGGRTWNDVAPPADDGYQFVNPFVMDPLEAKHLLTAGNAVYERVADPTAQDAWVEVFDLGTRTKPGDADAEPAPPEDPLNVPSAMDVRSVPGPGDGGAAGATPAALPAEDRGATTIPGGGTGAPGTFDDREFTIAAGESAGKATIRIEWASSSDDWDVRVLRDDAGTLTEVGASAAGGTTSEQVVLVNPRPARYVVRVDNFAATPGSTFRSTVAFTPGGGTAVGEASAAYVAFCGHCDVLNTRPFGKGLATNVRPDGSVGKKLEDDNWHIARAEGLPDRYITSVQMDPADVRTVYVTVAGYSRRWLRPGALDEGDVGRGHVFKSTDAGETFKDVSGNLPDTPAGWSVVRNGQLVVGTDVGVFIAPGTDGGRYEVLGTGLPAAPVFSMELKPKATPGEPDTLIVATQGRGVQRYVFEDPAKPGAVGRPASPAPASGPGTAVDACAPSNGFRSVALRPRGGRAVLGFTRRVRRPVTVDVFQTSRGRQVLGERLVARFPGRASSVRWDGRANRPGRRVTDGVYVVRWTMRYTERGRTRVDTRRQVLRRSRGRFTRQRSHYRRASCGVLQSFKLERPVFGGPRNSALLVSFRLSEASRVQVDVLRGDRVVRRFGGASQRSANRTFRLRFDSERRPRGEYRVRIRVGRTVANLYARRL